MHLKFTTKINKFQSDISPTYIIVFLNIFAYLIIAALYGNFWETDDSAIGVLALSLDPSHYWMFWTIFTTLFIHGNFVHFISNMILLLVVGLRLQDKGYSNSIIYIGFFVTGIFSGLLSLLIFFDNSSYTLGSSSAIFGLIGITAGIEKKRSDPNLKLTIGLAILILIASITSQTNTFSHIIGFTSGFIIGISSYIEQHNKN